MRPEDITRYRRQISLPGFGTAGQEALLDGHVAIIGAGGLGSPALLYLAGAGIGTITLIDDDVVDVSNLQRQIIHPMDKVGTPKVESAAAQVRALNPNVSLRLFEERLTWSNAREVLADADVVLDGTDNFDARHLASAACARLGIPHVWASILGFEAQLSVFYAGKGPIYEDLFPTPPAPGVVPNCAQAGVLGPIVGVVGSAMAMEAIKLITGVGEPLIGKLGYIDSLTGMWEYIPVTGNPEVTEHVRTSEPARQAPTPADELPDVPETSTIPDGAVLIDVRDPHEHAAFTLADSVNIPLGDVLDATDLPAEITGADGPIVVYCAGGIRSAKAVAKLQELGATDLVSLHGGIDGWLEARA
ncbi:molybdopterin biosynthesis protein MoeB [Corynebacterium yudongzhengii]|uniref:Molybdopterin biosynthesis protein MoeB n=1 Tax=Corynebacterium yudongzhengii TaxID=2080740 RepID=A0A2U1T5J3_9CORY|nr:ThiF family adenylyltransferase [Corynebacterium yudongzhengii]AWB81035.1 molybdopterin biosynthesis protein MoeB [Corynebacterium yudongzhengii]PWC01280.1 molybdopterin biosynthesis protein MoeB [Corynebacterium yudongzhengii]